MKLYKKYNILDHNSDHGGNGKILIVENKTTHEKFAMKKLQDKFLRNNNWTRKRKIRFKNEINILKSVKQQNIDGVIPIIDSCINEFWYTMPIASPIDINSFDVETAVDCILQITETLILLHRNNISHRDLKPDNILLYNNRYVLCDFGLVGITNNPHDITKSDKQLGAKWTIAPEMERYPMEADGKKADIYSLAKTLWILLTHVKEGFEGMYEFDSNVALHEFKHLQKEYLVELERLIHQCTNHIPESRPNINEFKEYITTWKANKNDDFKFSKSSWDFISERLFKKNRPTTATWTNVKDIYEILNIVCRTAVNSYLFFPDGGDLDLDEIELTQKKELDLISSKCRFRINAKSLEFNSFHNCQWNYFLLTSKKSDPVVGDDVDDFKEFVVEDEPNHYVSAKDEMYRVYDYDQGKPLPPNARTINRYLQGKFLIVLKFGPYNFIQEVTDGRHNEISNEKFRTYISCLEIAYQAYHPLPQSLLNKIELMFFPQHTDNATEASHKIEINNHKRFDINDLETLTFKIMNTPSNKKDEVATYRFRLCPAFTSITSESLNLYLNKEHFIRALEYNSSCILEVPGINQAREILENLNQTLNQIYGDINCPYFVAEIRRTDKPKHFFTKEELYKILQDADDRVPNKLVLDSTGHFNLIHTPGAESRFYPVEYEIWQPRNCYTGKYADLDEQYINELYYYFLYSWHNYLRTNMGQPYQEWIPHKKTEEELIKGIKLFY